MACPWLIKRFIDSGAEFLFVDESQLLQSAEEENATPFDAPRLPEVKLDHRGRHCTFDAILDDYRLNDTALRKLAVIVRAADIRGQEMTASEGAGLKAIAHGFAFLGLSDEERLARGFPIYDALYAYVQQKRDKLGTKDIAN